MNSYKVGKGKPPKHAQFRPGQSGNPSGRRKGSQNLRTVVNQILKKPIRIKQGGRIKKVPTLTAIILRLVENALKGDRPSIVIVLDLAQWCNNEPSEAADAQKPSSNDGDAVAQLWARIAAIQERNQQIELERGANEANRRNV